MTIKAGTLIDGTGAEPLTDMIITVVDDRISAIRPAAESSEPVDLDCGDLTVIPGLIDCHDHLDLDVGDEEAQSREPVSYMAMKAVANAKVVLDAGITTLRYLGAPHGVDLELRRAIAAGEIPGPRLFVAAEPIMRTGGHAHFLGREADGVDDVRRAVREQLKKGADQIKVMASGGMSTAGSSPIVQEFTDEEIAAAIDEAHRALRPIAAHAHGGSGVTVAVRHGVDTIEHGVLLTREQVELIARSDTVLISTESVARAVAETPDMPDHYREKISGSLAASARMLAWAHEAGVTVAVGCDTAHARMDIEMSALVEAGWNPLEAIRCLTLNGAKVIRQQSELGSIEVGKIADLVAIDGDPLTDPSALRSVHHVMQAGRLVN
ncbi:metal-dependent hydrolase family protein [Georgenia faecalis]|uniref:Amidohydrolase family protein n=1 Tax=Georgenia faecalis TaxID=2483799 RepID=A0ABV9D9F2_9MICO|nr:amidohydrolase family protein [Georgenia faecalis]